MNQSEVEEITRAVLANWPLYDETDIVQARFIHEHSKWSIQYTPRPPADTEAFSAHHREQWPPPNLLSINVTPGVVLYLLFIQVHPDYRGKGFGHQLYQCVIELARRFGCLQVRQTPSGGCPETGESRLNYLLRHGWVQDGETEVIKNL